MFDIGWTETALIAIVAILVIGPKELPVVLRTVGKYIGQARRMARDFQNSLEDVAREAEMDQALDAVKKAGDIKGTIRDGVKDAVMKDFPDIENDMEIRKEEERLARESDTVTAEPHKPGEEPAWLKDYMATATADADAQEPVLKDAAKTAGAALDAAETTEAADTPNTKSPS